MENAEEIGLSRLAAAVIYEMTFCGFMDEEVDAERQKLQEAYEFGKRLYRESLD